VDCTPAEAGSYDLLQLIAAMWEFEPELPDLRFSSKAGNTDICVKFLNFLNS
jgi:hypothetical protein